MFIHAADQCGGTLMKHNIILSEAVTMSQPEPPLPSKNRLFLKVA